MDKAGIAAMLQKLVAADGPSGTEGRVADVARGLAADFVSETHSDALGNLVALRRGTTGSGRIMLAAHMDEIGLIVTKVDARVFARRQGGRRRSAFGDRPGSDGLPLRAGRRGAS